MYIHICKYMYMHIYIRIMYRERESERELASYICVQVQGRSMQITAAPTGSTPTC